MSFTQLFPNASLQATPATDEQHISIPYHNQWLIIPIQSLSERERYLIDLQNAPSTMVSHSPVSQQQEWLNFFTSQVTRELPSWQHKTLQIVYLTNTTLSKINNNEWQHTLKAALPFVQATIYYTDDICALLMSNDDNSDYTEDIYAVTQALDADFNAHTALFVGQVWQNSLQLNHLIKEEQAIFQQNATHTNITNLSDSLFAFYTQHARQNSTILRHVQEQVQNISGAKELIHAMWHAQGNMTQAANLLYLHRNSLQYRLDKFFEQTHLSLRQINTLALCYICTLN